MVVPGLEPGQGGRQARRRRERPGAARRAGRAEGQVRLSLYGRFFAAWYDRTLTATEEAGLREKRRALLARARGTVVELGAGTGANLDLYPPIDRLVVTEPEEPMLRRLRERAPAGVEVVGAPADRLPMGDSSVDTVVSTLVLCTVDDPAATLSEVRRVLRPGGRLLFLEHVRSDEPGIARKQERWHGVWHAIGHGCHTNRDTVASIESAGFTVGDLARDRVPKAPSIVRPLVIGEATR